MNALPLPDDLPTQARPDVAEIVRVWWNVDKPAITLRAALTDPSMVGEMLAEVAWHFSKAYGDRPEANQHGNLDKIRAGWEGASARMDAALRQQQA